MKIWQIIFGVFLFFLPVQLGKHFWPSESFLFGLKIDYLSPTFYLTDIFLFLIAIFWTKERVFKKNVSFSFRPKSKIVAFLVGFFLLVNICLAKSPFLALIRLVKILEFYFLFVLVTRETLITKHLLSKIIPLVVFYQSAISLFQFTLGKSLGGIFWLLGERTYSLSMPSVAKVSFMGRQFLRPYGTFSHPNSLAGFFLVCLLIMIFKKKKKLFDWLSIFFSLLVLFFSFSRTVWFSGYLLGILIIYHSFFIDKKNFTKGFFLTFSFLLSMFLITKLFPGKGDESFLYRWRSIEFSWEIFKTSPIVGVGLNNYLPQLAQYFSKLGGNYWLQPVHNQYLLILAETGVVGLSMFLLTIFFIIKKLFLFKNWEIFFLMAAILLTGILDHYWLTLQQNHFLFAIILGLGFSRNRKGF